MPEFAAGEILTADKLNRRGIPKYAHRTTSSSLSASSTAVGVLRLDSIAVVAGRSYVINMSTHPNFTIESDTSRVEVRGTTSGTATTSSPILSNNGMTVTNFGTPVCFRFVYIAGSTATLSILLCTARNGGTGSVSLYADGTRNTELWVEDMGVATDTGVDV